MQSVDQRSGEWSVAETWTSMESRRREGTREGTGEWVAGKKPSKKIVALLNWLIPSTNV